MFLNVIYHHATVTGLGNCISFLNKFIPLFQILSIVDLGKIWK